MVLPRPFLSLRLNKINSVNLYKRTNGYIILKKKLSDAVQNNCKMIFYQKVIQKALYSITQEI